MQNKRNGRSPDKNQSSKPVLPLILTTGEPAGIGMDIFLQLAISGKLQTISRPIIVLADAKALARRAKKIYTQVESRLWRVIARVEDFFVNGEFQKNLLNELLQQKFNTNKINCECNLFVIDILCDSEVVAGQLSLSNADMVMMQLQLAHKLAFTKKAAAIVTGPLHKSVLIDAGLTLADGTMFTGHTEFFMQQSGCKKVVMMLANNAMKVALVTTHLPLKDIPDAITADNVRQTIRIVLDDLRQKFAISHPKILVCGLNPHAGEGGHLGMEEIEIINPVINEFQQQGVDISDAMPADTLFTKHHLQHCDVVISMYHDQGLPVLKSHGFGDTVNITLGLPYIRTSVDHGTALDLAGTGKASSSSLWQALIMADKMAKSIDTV